MFPFYRRLSLLILIPYAVLCGDASAREKEAGNQETHWASVVDSLKVVLSRTKDTSRIVVLVHLIERIKQNNPGEVMMYGLEAKKLTENISNVPLRAMAYKSIGNAYFYNSDFTNALFYFLMSMRLFERMGDTAMMVRIYNNVGAIYNVVGKNDIAKKYLLMTLEIARNKNIETTKFIYNNLGNIAFDEHRYMECIQYFKKALAIELGQDSNAIEKCIMLNNIGESYYIMNELDSAAYYFNKVINLRSGNDYYIAAAYSGLGKIATAENDFKQAETLLFNAKSITSENGYVKTEVEVLKNIADLFKKQKRYQDALEYYTRYKELADSVYSKDMDQQVNELQVRYETQKKNEQIKTLNKDSQLAIARADKQSAVRNFLITAIAFIFIVSLAVIRNNYLKQKINKMLSETNARISEDNTKLQHENILAQYEVLKSKTNPHFLFNSLNTLSSIVINDTIAVEYIRRFSDMYRMILETESKTLVSLSQEMVVVNHYLYLQKMRFREKLIVEINIPDHRCQSALPPFAIQMVVENAIKHNIVSRLRNLTISIHVDGDDIVITNNLQKKYTGIASTSTGQKSIKGRYALLTQKTPSFITTENEYIVRLPLLEHKNLLWPKEKLLNENTIA